MNEENPPYRTHVVVYDNDDQVISEQQIRYNHLDDAMRAYGHAVEGQNRGHRDERRARENRNSKATPKE